MSIGLELSGNAIDLQSICNQYGLDQVMIMRAVTPVDDLAIPREELQAAREELSRKLLDIPITKSASGKVGATAAISYLAAMMVEAVPASKEPMPPFACRFAVPAAMWVEP